MSSFSPAASLLWAILSLLLLGFFLHHLYQFDRWESLLWEKRKKQQNGLFKKILTYSYILSVPLLVIYSVTLAALKYSYGYVELLDGKIIPTPVTLWSGESRAALKVLYILFSLAWAIEMISHLEELNFWLYLITSTPKSRPWLSSSYFIVWCVGSGLAIIAMPVIAGFAEVKYLEASVFIAGSTISFVITIASISVTWLFPKFLMKVQKERAEPEIVYRLIRFNELNNVRLIFRFMFIIPLMVLAIGGLSTNNIYYPRVTSNEVWRDLLSMLAAIGITVSSSITIMVFFPRTSTSEMANRAWRKSSNISNGTTYRPHTANHYQFPARQYRDRLGTQTRSVEYPPKAVQKRYSASVASFDFTEPTKTLEVSGRDYSYGYEKRGSWFDYDAPLPEIPRDAAWLTTAPPPEPQDDLTSPIAGVMTQFKHNTPGPQPHSILRHDPMPHPPYFSSSDHQTEEESVKWANAPTDPRQDTASADVSFYDHEPSTHSRHIYPAPSTIPDIRVSLSTNNRESTSGSLYTDVTPSKEAPIFGGVRPRPGYHFHNGPTEAFNVDQSVGAMIRKRAEAARLPPGAAPPTPGGHQEKKNGEDFDPFKDSVLLPSPNNSTATIRGSGGHEHHTRKELYLNSPTSTSSSESLSTTASYQTQTGQAVAMAPAIVLNTQPSNDDNRWVQDVSYEAMRLTGMRYGETAGTASTAPSPTTPGPHPTGPRLRADSAAHLPPIITTPSEYPKSHEGQLTGSATNSAVSPTGYFRR